MPDGSAPPKTTDTRVDARLMHHLIDPIRRHLSMQDADALLRAAGLTNPGEIGATVDETVAANLLQILIQSHPKDAPRIFREAGARSAAHIATTYVPSWIRWALRALPHAVAIRWAAKITESHADAFLGSGKLTIVTSAPPVFEIKANPLLAAKLSHAPVCAWHCAFFESLCSILLRRRYTAREVTCCATGALACRFALSKPGKGATCASR